MAGTDSIGWRRFSANVDDLSLLADTGDFFQMRHGGTEARARLLELSIFQRGSTTLVGETIRIVRGTVALSGSVVTAHKYGTTSPAADTAIRSLPTNDVSSVDFEYFVEWKLLDEALLIPTTELHVPMVTGATIGIGKETTTAHTGVGVQIVWEEFTGD